MAQELANLDAFKAQRDPALANLPDDDNLASGIGTAYAIVGYKGKSWSLRYRGENHLFKTKVKMDDGSVREQLSRTIDVVILDAAPGKSKSYFPNYEDGAGDPPLCASLDGIVPDPGVEQKQAEACAICPRNELKIQANGRRGKECTDYKRLAVALMPNATKPMFGEPLMEPVFLRVPPASLNALVLLEQKMGKKGLGYHYSAYLTRISFVELDAKGHPMSYPQMQFFAVRPLTGEELKPILAMRADPQCERITGEAGRDSIRAIAGPTSLNVNLEAFKAAGTLPNPAQAKTLELAASPPSQAPVTGPSTAPVATKVVELEEDTGFTTVAAATKSPSSVAVVFGGDGESGLLTITQPATKSPSERPIDPPPAPVAPGEFKQATTTVADTGEPEESDEELDRRIAGIINKASK